MYDFGLGNREYSSCDGNEFRGDLELKLKLEENAIFLLYIVILAREIRSWWLYHFFTDLLPCTIYDQF